MPIAHTVRMFLDDHSVPYEIVSHPRSLTSLRTAESARIDAEQLAKAVLLEDDLEHSHYLMAVLPATRHVELGELALRIGRPVHLATEEDAAGLFGDCEAGAIPALGLAYGIETVIEDRMLEQPDLYFEAGDHEHLVHVSTQAFATALADCPTGRFSR